MTTGILPANQILERLKSGGTAVGTMVGTFAQSSMPVLLANAGFDFFLLDNEHGMFDYETMETLCRVAVGQGITPIVRPADHTYTWTAKVLDTGAQGLLMPRVYTVEQVRSIISMAKYPPAGIRGSALSRAYVGYKNANAMEVMAEANEQSMLCIQIETRESYAVRDEIAALPEVDCLFVGPNDFLDFPGAPGQHGPPGCQFRDRECPGHLSPVQQGGRHPDEHPRIGLPLGTRRVQHAERRLRRRPAPKRRTGLDRPGAGRLELTRTCGPQAPRVRRR